MITHTQNAITFTTLGNFTIIPSLGRIRCEAPRPSFVTFWVGLNISAVVALVFKHFAVVFVRLRQNNDTISYVKRVNLEIMDSARTYEHDYTHM